MQKLSDNQLIYRAYLASPLWKQKRGEALAFYGCKCMRCHEWGNDVHHKTYERVGGNEIMEDFEILCRDCHEAHHSVDKMVSRRGRTRGIHFQAAFKALKRYQKERIKSQFGIFSDAELYSMVIDRRPDVMDVVLKILGCDFFHGNVRKNRIPYGARRYGVPKGLLKKNRHYL